MNSPIGGCHTEPQEDVDLNGGWVSSGKCKNWHQNGRVETGFLSSKSKINFRVDLTHYNL
jgi:hypothetical protein